MDAPLGFRLGFATLLLAGLFASEAAAAPQPPLPAGWLAVWSTPEASAAEELFSALLSDLDYEFSGDLRETLAAFGVNGDILGRGPLLVGLASTADGQPYPFLQVAVDDYDAFVARLDGERTGDVAVARLAGFDLAVLPGDGWATITLLPFQQAVLDAGVDDEKLLFDDAIALSVEVSEAGIARLNRRAGALDRRSRAAARRALMAPLRWPPRLDQLDALIGGNEPFWRRMQQRVTRLRLVAERPAADAFRWRVEAIRRDPGATGPATPPPVLAGGDDAIVRGWLAETPRYLTDALALLTAYAQGRPDYVEAKAYSAAGYAAFESKLQEAAAVVTGVGFQLTLPRPGDPVLANRSAVVACSDADRLIETLREAALLWNRLIRESRARTELVFDATPLGPEGGRGVRLSADMVRAAGVSDTPEMRRLLNLLVGNNGRLTITIVRLDDRRVLVADAEEETVRAAAARLRQTPAPPAADQPEADRVASIAWRVDSQLAWRAAVWEVDSTGVIGRRPPATMPRSPAITAETRADNAGGLTATVSVPRETLRAWARAVRGE